jgi:uncharacterized repeat protein (TIGR01451 family)
MESGMMGHARARGIVRGMGSAWTLRRLLACAAFVAITAVLVGVPLAASATEDINGFELDGNAAGASANDWDALGTPLGFTGFRDDPTDDTDLGYGSGQTKDTRDIDLWTWEQADVTPAKSDIVNDYAAVYSEDGNLILYFGQNRQLDESGDANVGFWFLKNPIGVEPDGSFSGVHAEGDVLVQSEFTNGGSISDIRVYEWLNDELTEVTTADVGTCAAGKLGTLDACAIVNPGPISTSWAGILTAPFFFEGGLNLSALFGQTVPCFSTFLTNTRTSQAESADLKDFGLGEVDTCASLTITKQATPSDATQFGYSTGGLTPATFTLASGQSRTYTNLQPGPYSVVEDVVPAGWALESLTCPVANGPGTSTTINGATASITLGFVGHVECTYVNKRPPQVRVLKDLVPANDSGKFDLRINGTVHADDVGDDGDTGFKTVATGPVTVDELAGTGTALGNYVSSVACDSGKGSANATSHTFSVDFGDQVTCTITNTRKGKIIVEKQTLPNGDPQVFSFAASYDADGFSLSDGQQNDSGGLAPGTYSVSETVPAGWDLKSAVCSDGSPAAISLQAGEVVTCVFTNEKDARIVVEKQTLPNGDPQSFHFDASYDADGFDLTDGQQNNSGDLDPGNYSVSEDLPAGWDLESAVCSDGTPAAISLQAGEVVTCVFTNEKDARIVVEKQTDPDGAAQTFSFTASYDADGFSLSDGQSNNSGDLDPDTYSVSETVPANWVLTSAVCSDQSSASAIELSAGEVVTCVFTNTLDRGKIVVEKQTLPNGDPQAFSFDASYDADGFTLSDGQSNDSGSLLPGTYSVSEDVPAGWDLESAICSDGSLAGAISLQSGEVVTCVFTNEKDARIVVEKQTLPNGDPQSFQFIASYDADGFTLSDGQQNDSGDLDPGAYSVSENVPVGWDLESAVCSDESAAGAISLQAGEVVTCVFTNTKRPPGVINVIKTANPTSVKEPGGPVNFTVTVENTGPVNVTINSVVDDRFGNLANVAGGSPSGCFAVPFVLTPGQSSTCTFPKTVSGAAGTSHVNVVTASGVDTSQNPVSDSDDATVIFTERLIDLVVVKDATSPTPLNGIVNYTMTVTNKGPDTATNVQLVDPAPAGITYLTVNPGSPTCTLTPALITCGLGTLDPNQSKSVTVTARATTVGTKTNTATTTGEGGRETNPADNTDTAVTVVPAPVQPPTPKPTYCLTLTVTPKMITADGKPDTVKVKVTAGPKRVKGTMVRIKGAGVKKGARSNAKGIATLRVNPKRPGVLTITAVETKQQQVCGPRRIGAVGVFLPPLTG